MNRSNNIGGFNLKPNEAYLCQEQCFTTCSIVLCLTHLIYSKMSNRYIYQNSLDYMFSILMLWNSKKKLDRSNYLHNLQDGMYFNVTFLCQILLHYSDNLVVICYMSRSVFYFRDNGSCVSGRKWGNLDIPINNIIPVFIKHNKSF